MALVIIMRSAMVIVCGANIDLRPLNLPVLVRPLIKTRSANVKRFLLLLRVLIITTEKSVKNLQRL